MSTLMRMSLVLAVAGLSGCAVVPLVPVAAGAAGAVMIDQGLEQKNGGDGLF